MFAKNKRLRKEKDIKAVFGANISRYSTFFGLKAKKNELNCSRFTVIVGTKVSKKAVIRNKIKRRIRVILKEKEKMFTKNVDLLVLTLKGAEQLSMAETRLEIEKLLKLAKLI